jgi:hypothetical protein
VEKGDNFSKLLYIKPDKDMIYINSPVVKDYSKSRIPRYKIVADSLTHAMKEYPAQHYIVVVSDYSRHDKVENLADIRKSLEEAESETGKKIDVICFDTSPAPTEKLAEDLKHKADYLVAPKKGTTQKDLNPILSSGNLIDLEKALELKMLISPAQLAKKIVADAAKNALSSSNFEFFEL